MAASPRPASFPKPFDTSGKSAARCHHRRRVALAAFVDIDDVTTEIHTPIITELRRVGWPRDRAASSRITQPIGSVQAPLGSLPLTAILNNWISVITSIGVATALEICCWDTRL